jgi:hypothetical protein
MALSLRSVARSPEIFHPRSTFRGGIFYAFPLMFGNIGCLITHASYRSEHSALRVQAARKEFTEHLAVMLLLQTSRACSTMRPCRFSFAIMSFLENPAWPDFNLLAQTAIRLRRLLSGSSLF